MNNNIEIDASQVEKMFAELDERKRKNVYRTATKNALNIVKKQALQNLKGVINPKMFGRKDKWGNSFRTGIVSRVYKDGKSGIVHIMKNFKLKFFELGTKERQTTTYRGKPLYKNRDTGRIKAYHFFKKAKQSKESEVFESIDSLLSESIKKINQKYKGK